MNKILITGCAMATAFAAVAMPTKKELTQAQKPVEAATKADLAAFKAGQKTAKEVAESHLALAAKAENQAEKYLYYQGAFKIYARSGEYSRAIDTLETLKRDVKDVTPEVIDELVGQELHGVAWDNAKKTVASHGHPKRCSDPVGKATLGDYTWSYQVNNGEATIEAMKDGKYVCVVSPAPTGDVAIPLMLNGVRVTSIGREVFCYCSGLKSVRIPEGVKSVGWCAFYNCTNLVAGTLPQSLKSIGHGAFAGCCGLTEMTIPAGVTNIEADAFLACTKIKSIAIPSGVKCIKEHAFDLCSGLTQVVIPSSVESIGRQAFFNCKGLKSLTISSGVKNIDSIAFANCVELTQVVLLGERPKSAEDVFQNCPKLKEIYVPANAKSWAGMKEWQGIPLVFDAKETVNGYTWSYWLKDGEATIVPNEDGKRSFKGEVVIPSTLGGVKVTSIGGGAFMNCSFKSVKIPEGVTAVGHGAFAWIGGLKSVEIPSSVTNIGGLAFISSSEMESFHVAADNPAYSSRNGMLCTKDGSTLLAGINGEVVIPDGVTGIGGNAFHRCGRLKSVTVSASVANIHSQAFFGCGGLTSVTMLGERPKVADNAFENCASLKAIHVPANAKSWAGMKEWQGIPLVFDAK